MKMASSRDRARDHERLRGHQDAVDAMTAMLREAQGPNRISLLLLPGLI